MEELIHQTNPYLSEPTRAAGWSIHLYFACALTLILLTVIFLRRSSAASHFLPLLHYNKSQPKSQQGRGNSLQKGRFFKIPPPPPKSGEQSPPSIFHVPVRKQEGADVRHRWGRRSKLRQRHDVFEGDVRLSAHVHHPDLLRGTVGASAGGAPDDLHHHGLLDSPEGLRALLMAGLGQLLPIHLETRTRPGVTVAIGVCSSCH